MRFPQGLKNAKGRFPCIIALHLKKICYKVFLCVNTVSGKVVDAIWPICPCKMVRGVRPLLRENLAKTDQPPPKTDFQSILIARTISAVRPSEKVQLTRIGSPLRACQ